MPKESEILFCSFCGKSQHEVRKLIAGPKVFICDLCTDICVGVLVEEQALLPGKLENMPNLESLIQKAQDIKN